MPIPGGRPAVLAAVTLLVAGFGGGFLTAKLTAPHAAATAPQVAPAASGFDWPLFGNPRAADAPRAGVSKPDGFADLEHAARHLNGSPRSPASA